MSDGTRRRLPWSLRLAMAAGTVAGSWPGIGFPAVPVSAAAGDSGALTGDVVCQTDFHGISGPSSYPQFNAYGNGFCRDASGHVAAAAWNGSGTFPQACIPTCALGLATAPFEFAVDLVLTNHRTGAQTSISETWEYPDSMQIFLVRSAAGRVVGLGAETGDPVTGGADATWVQRL